MSTSFVLLKMSGVAAVLFSMKSEIDCERSYWELPVEQEMRLDQTPETKAVDPRQEKTPQGF